MALISTMYSNMRMEPKDRVPGGDAAAPAAGLLAAITADLAAGDDLDALLRRVLGPVVRLAGASAGAVRVLTPHGDRLELVGEIGLPPAVAAADIPASPIPSGSEGTLLLVILAAGGVLVVGGLSILGLSLLARKRRVAAASAVAAEGADPVTAPPAGGPEGGGA